MKKGKRRCKLCGAKLKDSDICPECGYNNSAYGARSFENWAEDEEKYSYANLTQEDPSGEKKDQKAEPAKPERRNPEREKEAEKSSDSWDYSQLDQDYEPKREQGDPKWGVPNEDPKQQGRKEREKKRRRRLLLAVAVVLAICLLPRLAEVVINLVDDVRWEIAMNRMLDERENSGREGSADGSTGQEAETRDTAGGMAGTEGRDDGQPEASGTGAIVPGGPYETQLGPGLYVAGIHFPTGTYRAELVSGGGSVHIWDETDEDGTDWQSEYLYESGSEEDRTLKDLELTQGTVIRISNDLVLSLRTLFQGAMEEGEANPLTDGAVITDCAVVGEDLEPGTYLASMTDESESYGTLVHRYTSSYDTEEIDNLTFTEEQPQFQNLILKEGDVLVTVNCSVSLEPAQYDLSGYRGQPY